MSILASLAFVIAAVVAVAALRLTIAQYSATAFANVAALRATDTAREFRFQAATIVARPTVGGDVVRIAARKTAPRQIRSSSRLRAAA